jgi:hypothetical protein
MKNDQREIALLEEQVMNISVLPWKRLYGKMHL